MSIVSLFTMLRISSDWTGKHSQMLADLIVVDVIREWWVEEDLNLRPHAYQACALTT